jgi:translocation and assembly module TamB
MAALWGLAASPRALAWAVAQGEAAARSAGVELRVDEPSGSLLGTVRASRLTAARQGLAIEARAVEIELDLLRLAAQALRGDTVALGRLAMAELRIATEPSGEPTTLPASLALPLPVSVARVRIDRLEWTSAGGPAVVIADLAFGYAGDGERHRIDALALRWQPPGNAPVLALAGEGQLGATAPFPLDLALRAGWGVPVPAPRAASLLPAAVAPEGGGASPRRKGRAAPAPATARVDASQVVAARAAIGGTLAEPAVRIEADAARGGARARVRLAAQVRPFDPAGPRLGATRLEVEGVDPAAWWPGAPKARLRLEAEAATDATGRLSGRWRATNAQPAPLDAGGVPVVAIDGPWRWDPGAAHLRLEGLRVHLAGAGTLLARLTLAFPDGARPRVDGQVDLTALDLRALDRRWPTTRLSGRLGLAADAVAQRADLALEQSGLRVDARLEQAASVVRIPAFRLQVPGRGGPGELQGRLEASLHGERPFLAEVSWRGLDPSGLRVRMQGIDPAAASPARAKGSGVIPPADPTSSPASAAGGATWPAAVLNGRASVRGQLQPAWTAEIEAALVASEVRLERPLALRGELRSRVSAQRVEGLDLRLESGRNRVRATGAYGRAGDAVDLTVDVADPASLLSRSVGRLALKARVEGTPERPLLAFRVSAEALAARGVSIEAFEGSGTLAVRGEGASPVLAGPIGRLGAVRVEAQARRLSLPGQGPFDLTLRLSGDPARHQLDLDGRASGAEARATVAGGLGPGGRWQGELRQLEGRSRIPIRLLAPVAIAAAPGEFRLGPARLTVASGRVAIDSLEWRAGRLVSRGSLTALPLGPIHDLLTGRVADRQEPTPITSSLEIGGEWALTADPELTGTVALRRERGDLALAGARPFPLGLTRSDVDLRFEAGRLRGRARVEGSAVGEASATLALDPAPRLDLDATLALRVDASVRSLRPFARLLPAVAEIDGAFVMRLEGRGTPRQPVLAGTLSGQRLRVDAPQVGVALRDGRVEAALSGGLLTVTTLEARGGDGRFTASGAIPLRPGGAASSLRWQAERLALLSRPDRRVVLDGQGALGFERGQYRLAGKLRAREGYIEFGRGNRATLGEDVVVRGRGAPPPAPVARGERALDLQLEFDFGDAFRLIGSGLDTLVRGRVALATSDGGQLSTRGTVSTDRGTFTAFGQRLEIDRGAIVFNGPVDNPGLDIVALRRLPSVQAGVELTGTARAPRVRITSNPPLPQGEQLSWLVLGRALDSASQADAALLASAAAAMFGGDGGVPVNRRIADAFGLDDVGVRSSGVLSGQVVTVGKRVSDRVYFAYEQAVSTASNLLRIDLELHRFVSLRAEAGSVSGFGIVFTRNLR